MQQLKTWIENNCFNSLKRLNNRICLKSWWDNRNENDRYNEIINHTQFLPDNANMTQRIYHIYHDMMYVPKCSVCQDNTTSFINFRSGYYKTCSQYCSTQEIERRNKISQGLENSGYERIEKAKKTNLNKYGVETLFNLKSHQDKMRQSKIEKYGSTNNINKNKETCLERYGVDTLLKIPQIQKHMFESKIEKYGHAGPYCDEYSTSKGEQEVLEFLNHYYEFSKNKTLLKYYELDAYSETLNLAVEYCGLYWHSSRFKDKNYHYIKYKLCKDLGVDLITIFEDEWKHKPDIVKNILKSRMGVYDQKLYARQTSFVDLGKEYLKFFEKYHLQGSPNHATRICGLTFGGEVVALCALGLHHRNSNIKVLNRLCYKPGIRVIGGASKLFKNMNEDFITWSDNRWSNGNVYAKAGLYFDGVISIDYSYVMNDNKYTRKSKQSMKKSNIGCPPHITEEEFCKNMGIYRIFDCGKIRWRYDSGN